MWTSLRTRWDVSLGPRPFRSEIYHRDPLDVPAVVEERAVLKVWALTGRSRLQPPLHDLGTLDEPRQLGQLALGDLTEALGRSRIARPGTEQLGDLLQRQAGALSRVAHAKATHRVPRITPSAADTLGLGQDARRLVVSDR